jgi:esterase/lipase superfamily enzyme
LILLAIVAMAGCKTKLMPTPTIYTTGEYTLFEQLPAELQSSKIDLMYITDRAPKQNEDGTLTYTFARSASAAFGSCVVEIGEGLDWDALVAASTTAKRPKSLELHVREINEAGRFAPSPVPMVRNEAGELVDDPQAIASQRALAEEFKSEVKRRLALNRGDDVYIYVHGFNNTFEYAACVLAEFWHFGGRHGLPILYTWPAGAPGLVRGYTHDRESCEFTIWHLKQIIKALASIPEVDKINVISHSRGTDVAGSALRELLIEERGAGRVAQESLGIGHVILASPDIDLDVVRQRYSAERFFHVCERLTIYVSTKDKALGLAEWLLQAKPRLGHARPEDFSESARQQLALIGKTDIIDSRVKGDRFGHSYYHASPAVSSDIILLLRYNADAGSPQRPLKSVAPNYWVLDDERYPYVDAASAQPVTK